MFDLLAEAALSVEWANTVIAVIGLCAAAVAIIQSSRSNRAAQDANRISREANQLAVRALEMQEDEGRLRLVVKPRMMCLYGEEEDPRPRPVVEVINLSAFPVTITQIYWKTNRDDKKGFHWKNPIVANPYGQLPARLPQREALTAIGLPATFSLADLQTITAAVAVTACGEQIEGMTEDWRETVASMVTENSQDQQPSE